MLDKPIDCHGCKLETLGEGFQRNCITHDIGYKSSIMVVAEALGSNEAKTGTPLIGATGSMFRAMLRQAGIEPELIYLTNVVKCRPPSSKTPDSIEAKFCSDKFLWREIEKVNPNIIIAVGGVAKDVLLPGLPGIIKTRGYVYKNTSGQKVLPVIHPSYIIRGNPEYWSITVVDLIKARKEATTKTLQVLEERFTLSPTIQDLREWSKWVNETKPTLSFDIETLGKDLYRSSLICCGFAWSTQDALCVPFLKRGGYEYWETKSEEEEAFEIMADIFANEDIHKVGQNIFPFDMPYLMDYGIQFRGRCDDTLMMHHIVAVELKHSLEFLTSIYTDRFHHKNMVKNEHGMLWASDETLRRYNLIDCTSTLECFIAIDREIDDAY